MRLFRAIGLLYCFAPHVTVALTHRSLAREMVMGRGQDTADTNASSICRIRPLTHHDQDIVWDMLMHAAHETSNVRESDILRPYAQDFGTKSGDLGVVATMTGDDRAVGAAWVRLLTQGQGFGFVAVDIPELAIALLPDCRGKGIGSKLLVALIQMVRETSFAGICLSCREDNPAFRLYSRFGFLRKPGTDVVNRTGGTSFTMILKLDNDQPTS